MAATVRDGTLNATRIDGTLFGGALRGNAVLGAGAPNRIQAALDIKGMDVGKASLRGDGKRAWPPARWQGLSSSPRPGGASPTWFPP